MQIKVKFWSSVNIFPELYWYNLLCWPFMSLTGCVFHIIFTKVCVSVHTRPSFFKKNMLSGCLVLHVLVNSIFSSPNKDHLDTLFSSTSRKSSTQRSLSLPQQTKPSSLNLLQTASHPDHNLLAAISFFFSHVHQHSLWSSQVKWMVRVTGS